MWTPCNHIARKHKIFAGLPTEIIMDRSFQNIVSEKSITNLTERWIAGALYYNWHPYGTYFKKEKNVKNILNYIGIGEAGHGADIVDVQHGRGAYLLCILQIVNNLKKNRFAQRIFKNILKWL